ncbi:ArsR/SmtB family transcription factor [Convivina praedatoris]|uniref:ArsR/SmtB family transcription factor n=1 Tax=Convivina praedatoris TaxID=2880963 RepID=UPI00200D63BD|nr:metalloregulator ArsR/SmtB family transcription factor [Convivina sp. LMG 32447]
MIFKLLSNPTRLRILLLLEKEPLSVSQIVTALKLEQSMVSHQLSLLRKHQLLTTQRDGKKIRYSLTDPHILAVVEMAYEHSAHVVLHQDHHYSYQKDQ